MTRWMGHNEEEPSFSLNDFRKWMENQNEEKTLSNDKKGIRVETRIPFKRLVSKINPEEGELMELAKDFRKNGGTILEMDGQTLLIEVDSGTFYISRSYVRKKI